MAAKKKAGGGRRRGRGEADTGKKAGETEVRTGELGALEPVVIESNDFDFHLKAIKAATEKKDTANNLLRGCYKAANRLNKHLGAAIKEVISLERADDPAALKQRLEVLGIALKETGSPIQLTVHDALLGSAKETYYKRGHADGLAAKNPDPRAPEGSDLANEYSRGWRHGNGENLGLTPEEVDAAASEQAGADGGEAEWPDDKDARESDGAKTELETAH